MDEREAQMDEIGAHMDERKARTEEKGGAHTWGEDEGGACEGARTAGDGARTPRGVARPRTAGGARTKREGHARLRGACT
jgi:hypothetical protein